MKRFTVCLLFVLLLSVSSIQSNFVEFGFRSVDIPPPPPPPNFGLQPKLRDVDVMVDITNDLSYRILQQHSIANRNNFAFSPTSLASVLIALYEGSQGGGATEIYNVLKLPWNRDLLRIGYRDIHRRLRKYFFNEENPLTGLTLSRENVSITSPYEDILEFYGYDLRADMHPFNDVSPAQSTTTTTPKPTESTASKTESTTESTTPSTTESTTSKTEEITTASSSSTSMTTESSTTASPTTMMIAEQTTTTTQALSTVAASTTVLPDVDTTTVSSDANTEAPENASEPAVVSDPETTTVTATSTTLDEELSTTPADDSTTGLYEETTTVEQDTTTTDLPTTTLETTTLTLARLVNTIDPENMLFPVRRNRRPSENRQSMLHRGDRVKRQYPLYYDGNQPPPFTITVTPIQSPIQPPVTDFHFVNPNGFYEPKRETAIDKKEIYHVFYLNAYETIQARYKVFNSILRFSYIESIRSSVLALELDSPDYELLIMIPDYGFGPDYLLQGLKLAPTLRVIRQQMRPRWVQAIVPDFKLKGNIFLTNDLQNMGILEVFEPARADFSPMTNESDIYVKHIEQKINVHLRTRPIDQLKRYVGPFNRPIEVSVNHPFLFFIVDKELDVAIMTGRVLNPLNVRIH